MLAFFLLIFAFLNENVAAEPLLRTCEPIRVEMCMGLGYNMTGMPNLGGNDVQQEADYNLKSFSPLIQYGCSQHLKLFLCSVYVPMCTEKVANPIGPCRGLCESVKSRCFPVLQGFGFPWPDALNCSRFPGENNHEHMCMEGPKDRVDVRAPVNPAVRKYDSGQVDCGGAGGMFDEADKKIAMLWITVWALFCVVASLASAFTLMLGGGKVRAPPLISLALCYFLVGAGWTLSIFSAKSGSCSTPDPIRLNNEDGLPNVMCAFVFLLLYYFGMAANVWWVCLCVWWLARAGFSWSQEKLHGLSSALHVCAWGCPAIQTVAALVTRDVGSDELTGTCYIGKNMSTLFYLVVLPYFIYFFAGAFLLTIGWVLVLRKPKPINAVSVPLTQGPPRKERDFLGALATLYAFSTLCVMSSFYVEYENRKRWISGEQKPSLWFFLFLRYFMSLFVGISSIFWIWSNKSAQVWKSVLKRLGPRSQHNKNAPTVLRYPVTHHSGMIVPLNSISRQSSRVHSHRKSSRSHHLRSGSETII
ncbi:frizzled-4-like isoform X2 [Sitophilus oryzae]|uniref:Frizzled-4 n=1 Tax=Sitophilus oryzae TaxID=7048 RepID=A0A6J2YJR0_SITOR|nr:frizzled-4-like isoform X1 [Sitophilus oryzae]XP_030764273.1 frizzled-4-like isoform X2 [Sitophilus oryzae]